MEAAVLVRTAILRNAVSSLEQPLDPSRTAAIARQLADNGAMTAGPDGAQGGAWAPVTELQGKLVEQLLKHLTKAEAPFRPGAAVLLGLVCRYVPARAFLASYGEWAAALLEVVRRDSGPVPRAAALRGLGDLFTRVRELLEVPGVRRDASGIAGRTLQLATPLLTDPDCQMSALAAVHTVLQALPTVARNHTVPLERSLAGLMAAPASPADVRCAAAAALALLPRASADDAAAWSALIRRVLLSLHTAIDLMLYHGGGGGSTVAADGGLGERAREQLEAVGQGVGDAEGLLGPFGFVSGGGSGGSVSVAAAARPDVSLTVDVTAALLQCLTTLVGRGSTSPVPVPAHALLLLVMRMLRVDGTMLLAPGRVAPSASAQSPVLALLPGLHVSGWEVLGLTARVVRTCLMPLMAPVCRLLAEHLRRIKAGGAGGLAITMPAAVRTALYRTMCTVLRVGGFAAGRYLAAEAVGMLVTELYGLSATQQQEKTKASLYGNSGGGGAGAALSKGGKPLGGTAATAGVSPPPAKKAKTTGDPLAAFDAATAAAAVSVIAPVASPADVEAQIAALKVAEALLQVYGPALPTELRGQLDALSYHMAAVLAEAAYRVAREPGAAAAARAKDVALLRVAATRTLAASLAAPWPSRHPFLSEGLQLLSAGASGAGGVGLAEACSEGLLALEALLRPRSAPLAVAAAARAGGGGIGGIGGSAADAAQGLQLPRPRLWSMLDPVQPQPQLPAAATAANGTVATTELKPVASKPDEVAVPKPGAAARAQAMDVEAGARDDLDGERQREVETGLEVSAAAPGAADVTADAAAQRAGTQAKGKGAKGEAKGGGVKPPAPAVAVAGSAERTADEAPSAADGTGKTAAAATATDMAGPSRSRKGVTAEVAPASTAAVAPAEALPEPAKARAPAGTATAADAAPTAAATSAFGDESEDSEGSLPEIDSGSDSGDSDDE